MDNNQRLIVFNFASRSRPDKCKSVIDNMLNLMTGDNYFINLKIDKDDPAYMRYVELLSHFPRLLIQIGTSNNKIHAINRDMETDCDIIVDVSDDFVFTTKGFDDIIRKHCGNDDFVLFPEPFADSQVIKGKNERIAIMLCVGIDYYKRDGYLFNPIYKSLFCDNEATAVARLRGRLKEVEENIFYHAHPAAGYGKADAQTQHTESFWKQDKATYERRKLNNFAHV